MALIVFLFLVALKIWDENLKTFFGCKNMIGLIKKKMK